MIEIYEGKLGGGKTYSATVRMVDHLQRGGVVCTNVRLKWEAVAAFVADVYGVELEKEQLWVLDNDKIGSFHQHVPWGSLRGAEEQIRVLVVVDEAHLYFNARDWNLTSRQLLAFLTQSDKVSVDVIFISQSALNIDKQFMRLVQYIWRFRDLEKWKIPGLGLRYPMKQILACQFDYDGSTLLERHFRKKDKRVFGLYETAALLTPFPCLETAKKLNLKKVEKGKPEMVKIFIPVAIVVAIVAGFILFGKLKAIGKPSSEAEVKQTKAAMPAKSPIAVGGDKKAEEAKYDIYAEHFQGFYGDLKALSTSEGWYQLGEMSERGFVVAVSNYRAKVQTPNGRTAWIVASRPGAPKVVPPDRERKPQEDPQAVTAPARIEIVHTSQPSVQPVEAQSKQAERTYRYERGGYGSGSIGVARGGGLPLGTLQGYHTK